MKTQETHLTEHPFLAGLSQRMVEQIELLASRRSYKPLELIFQEEGEANQFFLIVKGRVAIEVAVLGCESIRIQTLAGGDALGWSWLIPPHQWRFSARAIDATEVIVLDGQSLRDRCEADHDLGYELMKRFARVIVQRLEAARAHLLHFPDPEPQQPALPQGALFVREEE